MTRRDSLFLMAALLAGPVAFAADRPVRIAFVDTGNTGRSVTAEALAVTAAARDGLSVQVISRAVNLNPYNIHPEDAFITLLRQRGIDVSGHIAAQFNGQDAKFSDIILTMTGAHRDWIIEHFPETKDKVFLLGDYATGTPTEVLDAFGKPMDFYQKVLAQLDGLIAPAIAKATGKH